MSSAGLQPLDELRFYRVLGTTPGVALVFFTAVGCSSCRTWKRLLQDYVREHHDIRVFEIDAQISMGLAREYEVFHLPALFLFVDGEFHCALHCEARPGALRAAIDAAMAAPAQEAP